MDEAYHPDFPNIILSGPRQYLDVMRATLGTIHRRESGGHILRAVNAATASDRQLTFIPWTDSGRCNAVTTSLHMANGAAAGQPVRQCGGAQAGQPIVPTVTGTGVGAPVRIAFSPGMWIGRCRSGLNTGPGRLPHEVLLHEIAHALRILRGLTECIPVPEFGTLEELFACTLSNIFASENNPNAALRGDHGGRPLANPSGFATDPRFVPHLERIRGEHSELCRDLGRVRATFNPFARRAPTAPAGRGSSLSPALRSPALVATRAAGFR